jgi:two-component system response regulator AtoC
MAAGITRAFELVAESGFVYGRSEAIQSVNAIVGEIAQTDIPVLISGESGTGKEIYARLIHQLSLQRDLPFAKLNCTLLEPGELLARIRRSLGDGEATYGTSGTLFLDGIDELDVDCQKVMLAMIQEREAASGGRMSYRMISTTTRNLDKEIAAARFRRELYFRVNGVCVKLPALRERKADIVPLMEYFLEKHAAEARKKTPALSQDDEELLRMHAWPGNVRELENLARRIVAIGEPRAAMGDLRQPALPRPAAVEVPRSVSLRAVAREASRLAERDLILKALEKTHWNRKQAAKQLQISYKALLYKIKQMDVQAADLTAFEGEER